MADIEKKLDDCIVKTKFLLKDLESVKNKLSEERDKNENLRGDLENG